MYWVQKSAYYKPETPGEEMLYRKGRLRQPLTSKGKMIKTELLEAIIS